MSESTISAHLVKALRDKTNAGFKDCKEALLAAKGDMEQAIQIMEQAGKVKALGKANRTAQQGVILLVTSQKEKLTTACLLELNCETDFVAKSEPFKQFSQKIGECALKAPHYSCETLRETMEEDRLALIAQIGENVVIRRFVSYEAPEEGMVGAYAHGDANGARIGALVLLEKPNASLAHALSMHVAAMAPTALSMEDLSSCSNISEDGVLLEQSFIKEPSKSVKALLQENGNAIKCFVRFAVGEADNL